MTFKKDIEEQIEQIKQKLYKIYEEDPESPQLLKTSQDLDKLLNTYRQNLKNQP